MLATLAIVVGLTFVYLVLALICTTANEWIAAARGLRARTLEHGVRNLLGPLADGFYDHPLISTLSTARRRPSYIPPHVFSSAVLDLMERHREPGAAAPDTGSPAHRVLSGIDALKAKVAPRSPEHAAHAAALEDWFDAAMDRMSGVYKRRMQAITIAVAAALTLMTNADTLRMVGVLWRPPTQAAGLIDDAGLAGQRSRTAPAQSPQANSAADDAQGEEDQDEAATPATNRQLIGWSSDFARINQGFCDALQEQRDRACAPAANAPGCQQALRRISVDDRCRIDGARLLATDASPRGAVVSGALVPVIAGHLFGWLLTIVAISFGAACCFDMLSRFINPRSTGPRPRRSTLTGKRGRR